jgi:hypothetical protein
VAVFSGSLKVIDLRFVLRKILRLSNVKWKTNPDYLSGNILPWPARSPDLNPIEDIWDMIERRLTTLHRRPQTLAQLQHEIQAAWDQVPQEDIDHLFSSMPRRLMNVSKAKQIINFLSIIG